VYHQGPLSTFSVLRGDRCCQSSTVAALSSIEQDVPGIVHIFTVPDGTVQGLPNWGPVVEVVLSQFSLQVGRGLDGIVERHLGEEMVSHVGVLDVMEGVVEEPPIVPIWKQLKHGQTSRIFRKV